MKADFKVLNGGQLCLEVDGQELVFNNPESMYSPLYREQALLIKDIVNVLNDGDKK